jgi:hypothetical protein
LDMDTSIFWAASIKFSFSNIGYNNIIDELYNDKKL